MDKDKSSDKISVNPLEGSSDYSFWRRNARAYLTRYDPLLLGLKEEPQGNGQANLNKWREASAQAKGTITLLLSEAVQVRAIPLIEDENKTAYNLWQLLESTYTASNEQAIQNLRVQLDQLVYIEGTDWDEHVNKFNALIAQLAMQNVSIDDKQKKSMLIRSLPESFSVISTVASAQSEMNIESLDALVRAELDRKKNPHNKQGMLHAKANIAERRNQEMPWASRNQALHGLRKKKRKCHHCGKPGHYKRECRKFKPFIKKKNREKATQQPWRNNTNQDGNGSQNRQNQPFELKGLLTCLANYAKSHTIPTTQTPDPPFGGFMEKVKFQSHVAQITEHKTSDAYIDSGATHHFFHRRDSFVLYSPIEEEPVKAAASVSKIVGKGMVKLPINGGILVEA